MKSIVLGAALAVCMTSSLAFAEAHDKAQHPHHEAAAPEDFSTTNLSEEGKIVINAENVDVQVNKEGEQRQENLDTTGEREANK